MPLHLLGGNRPTSRAVLDNMYRAATPEGVALEYRLAGLWPRAVASGIDFIIYIAILYVSQRILLTLGSFGIGSWYILVFLVNFFYPILFEIFNDGRTPGKQLLRIRVVQEDGAPVGWNASMVRNLLRIVDVIPAFPPYLLGAIGIATSRRFQRMGDSVAGTVVVHMPRRIEAMAANLPALATTAELSEQEQRFLIQFAQRFPHLSPQRADELALLYPGLVKKLRHGPQAGGLSPAQLLACTAYALLGKA